MLPRPFTQHRYRQNLDLDNDFVWRSDEGCLKYSKLNKRKNLIPTLVLTYFDGANKADSTQYDVITLASVSGTKHEWPRFNREWRHVLNKHRATCLHVTDAIAQKNDFRNGWNSRRRDALIMDCVKLIGRHIARPIRYNDPGRLGLYPHSITIKLAEFIKARQDNPDVPSSANEVCATQAVFDCMKWGFDGLGAQNIHLYFDQESRGPHLRSCKPSKSIEAAPLPDQGHEDH